MRLLFDQNLSPRLVSRLADAFPESSHISFHGLDRALDLAVWDFARAHSFALVTKDTDFNDLATLRGFPPKVIWIQIGNCTTLDVEHLLLQHREALEQFEADDTAAILVLR